MPVSESVFTYAAPGLKFGAGASAEIGGLRLVAESTGGRRNRVDTLLLCRVEKPDDDAAEDTGASSGRGATRYEEPAPVEG